MQIDQESFDRIANLVHSDTSPVGIDAKKTHVLILHQLEQMQAQLDRMEKRVDQIWQAIP